MIEKVIIKRKLNDCSMPKDLEFWLSKSPEERISAMEILRRQYAGSKKRLQRVYRITHRSQS
jgi:hypothetical protein